MAPTVQDIRVFVETPKSLKPSISWEELKKQLIIPTHLPQIQTQKGLLDCITRKAFKRNWCCNLR